MLHCSLKKHLEASWEALKEASEILSNILSSFDVTFNCRKHLIDDSYVRDMDVTISMKYIYGCSMLLFKPKLRIIITNSVENIVYTGWPCWQS
jgi:hypothetical protein